MWIRICKAITVLSVILIVNGQLADAKEKESVLEKLPEIKAILGASPAIYRGDCPGVITFNGSITVNQAGTVKYVFAGSDSVINAVSGIDETMIFFCTGHENPALWNTLGDNASQNLVALSNIEQGNMLRYYWQCSSEVFAHGPRSCPGGGMEYACPQNFNGGDDSVDMRNVFQRWGPALKSDLRMVCGMSTAAYCHESNINMVWDNYNNRGMAVADSFINGLSGWGVVPLCITMGGPDIVYTPLYDERFTNQPNTSGSTHYHLLYAFGTGDAMKPAYIHSIPKTLPKFKLVAADIHPKLRTAVAPLAAFAGGKANVRIEPLSGAVHLKAVQHAITAKRVISREDYFARAEDLIQELGWQDLNLGQPVLIRLIAASIPVDGKPSGMKAIQKGVVVTYKRQVEVEGKRIDVIGAGGVVRIEMSNSGSVLNASRIWRRFERARDAIHIKSFEEAHDEALRKLSNPDAYKLNQWTWGYMEPSGNVKLDESKVVFQFAFVPKNHAELLNYPPRIIEISGEKN